MWKSQRKWLFLPLACSLWLAAGSTSQAETMYQISESELTRLEVNLNQLEKNNETKQQLLTEQGTPFMLGFFLVAHRMRLRV